MRADPTTWTKAEFKRLPGGPEWTPPADADLDGARGGLAWRSNGGAGRRHPARTLPFSLEIAIPPRSGRMTRAALIGVFASCAHPQDELSGAIGGMLAFMRGKSQVHRLDLIQGRHYSDAADLTRIYRPLGDGSFLETVSETEVDGQPHRVDVLTISLPPIATPDRIVLTDLGTPASFVVFDVLVHHEGESGCPFRGRGGQMALHELSSILRLKDGPRFDRSLRCLESSILAEVDLDEGRGLALTFLAGLLAAQLEAGGGRRRHGFLLQAARSLDSLESREEVAEHSLAMASQIAQEVFGEARTGGEALIHRSLAYLERHFAEDLTDAALADRVGLSCSHFRHLFRQVVKQPFHKYVLSLRLEKAREMILTTDLSMTEVAFRTGFASPAHFSRAFSARFGASPSLLRGGKQD